MRLDKFKMERQGLVEIGDKVEIIERTAPGNYYYIIEPAIAMSGCYQFGDRIKSTSGVVKDIEHTEQGFYVIVEFEE